ncbi:MAG: FHA domain-containing protein [Polyangiaceae bacterium]
MLVVAAHAIEPDGRPAPIRPIALTRGAVVLGRGDASDVCIASDRLSRRHTRFTRGPEGALVVEDLGSKNGTFVDGARIDKATPLGGKNTVVRLGDHFVLQVDDVTLFTSRAVTVNGGVVVGPVLGATLDAVRASARADACLHLRGETGAGKELLARTFAEETLARPGRPAETGSRPFIAVNCATIQPELAERLLFGTKRGAYSSADADVTAYVRGRRRRHLVPGRGRGARRRDPGEAPARPRDGRGVPARRRRAPG